MFLKEVIFLYIQNNNTTKLIFQVKFPKMKFPDEGCNVHILDFSKALYCLWPFFCGARLTAWRPLWVKASLDGLCGLLLV